MSTSQLLFPPDERANKAEMSSFKEKLLGKSMVSLKRSRGNLFELKLARAKLENGNNLLPKIFLEHSIHKELSAPWEDALVVKLLGKGLGFITMRNRLKKLWQLNGGFELLDLDHGFFLVKSDSMDDMLHVLKGGSWMLFDHYLSIKPWTLGFVASLAKIDSTLVWIHIPCLNIGYYDEDVLMSVAGMIGKLVKIDLNTFKVAYGKFARVCIEINLSQPVIGKVCLDGRWYKIECEELYIICAKCGCYGHYSRDCSKPMNTSSSLVSKV